MSLPPLTALRAFEAAARLGSLSGAARELNVTHAAIKQQVTKLEDWFGRSLMQREGRGVATTETGARLAAGLTEGLQKIKSTVESIAEDDAARPLRITLTPMFAVNWLMPRLGGFRAEHPDIELMLNPSAKTMDLAAEDYDMGFRFGLGTWPGLEAEPMLHSMHVAAAAPSLLAGTRIDSPCDLVDLPWVQELGMDERSVWLKSHGVTSDAKTRNIVHMPGHMVMEAIRSGTGIGIVGRAWVENDIAAGRIVALFEKEQDADMGYYMVYRPIPQRAPLKAFLKWVRKEIAS